MRPSRSQLDAVAGRARNAGGTPAELCSTSSLCHLRVLFVSVVNTPDKHSPQMHRELGAHAQKSFDTPRIIENPSTRVLDSPRYSTFKTNFR